MSSRSAPAQRRGRLILTGIAAVFVVPVIVAAILTMGPLEWQTTRTINYGILVKPALDLSSYGLTVQGEIEPNKPTVPGDWFLAVFYDKKCAAIYRPSNPYPKRYWTRSDTREYRDTESRAHGV